MEYNVQYHDIIYYHIIEQLYLIVTVRCCRYALLLLSLAAWLPAFARCQCVARAYVHVKLCLRQIRWTYNVIYIYIYVHIYIYIYIYITHVHVYTQHVYVCNMTRSLHACVPLRTCACTHAQTFVSDAFASCTGGAISISLSLYIYIYIYICIYTFYTYTYIYIYIYIYTHICMHYELTFILCTYTILYYTIPYHTIPYHTIPYHTIPCYTTLHYTTLHYTTLHYTTLHYTTLHYTNYNYNYNCNILY